MFTFQKSRVQEASAIIKIWLKPAPALAFNRRQLFVCIFVSGYSAP